MYWCYLILSFVAGIGMGFFFFGGLWLTVQMMTNREKPYTVFIASFIIRTAVVLAGFYLLLVWSWHYLLAAMAGFLVSRTVLSYKIRPGNLLRKEDA